MKIAITYLSCDKPELVKQSLPVLVEDAIRHKFHLFVADGSVTNPGEKAVFDIGYPTAFIHSNVRGGAGAAIVFALTLMLNHPENYDVVGLCESDVLLGADWFDRTVGLFAAGLSDGFEVGAVSARCFEDRVLFQRNGYAVMHNLGAGHILLTRAAAEIVLRTFRTAWTADNRRIFSQLAGIDIGSWWAFRFEEHPLTADWHWDAALAAHGYASLALTPSPVEMIGQPMTLAEQGLKLLEEPKEERRRDEPCAYYADCLKSAREGRMRIGVETQFHFDPNTTTWTYFPHQMQMLGGRYSGDWRFEECRGFGTFKWVAGESVVAPANSTGAFNSLTVPIFGGLAVLVSGGKTGGKVEVFDEGSGFKASPELPPEGEQMHVLQIQIPGALVYRNIHITALTPGVTFYGIQSRDKQPFLPAVSFDHSMLPPV